MLQPQRWGQALAPEAACLPYTGVNHDSGRPRAIPPHAQTSPRIPPDLNYDCALFRAKREVEDKLAASGMSYTLLQANYLWRFDSARRSVSIFRRVEQPYTARGRGRWAGYPSGT
jgi:hypothetical protein